MIVNNIQQKAIFIPEINKVALKIKSIDDIPVKRYTNNIFGSNANISIGLYIIKIYDGLLHLFLEDDKIIHFPQNIIEYYANKVLLSQTINRTHIGRLDRNISYGFIEPKIFLIMKDMLNEGI